MTKQTNYDTIIDLAYKNLQKNRTRANYLQYQQLCEMWLDSLPNNRGV